ncbi:unnamed protein product [Urochloa humidicola]
MDSVVDRGIGVCRCLVLLPNFSIYEQVPSRRRHLRRPSKFTCSATVAGHPLASAAGAHKSFVHRHPHYRATCANPTGPIGPPAPSTVGEVRSTSFIRFGEAYVYGDPRRSKPCVCQENLLRCAAN